MLHDENLKIIDSATDLLVQNLAAGIRSEKENPRFRVFGKVHGSTGLLRSEQGHGMCYCLKYNYKT